jgi:hypothetical protein
MPSSHIKGKGKRRTPGRPGGAKKTVRRPSGTRKRSGSRKRTGQSTQVVCHWWEIKPLPLSRTYKDHPWVFAIYQESNRPDGQHYLAFLFRNQQRTVFGIREWLGKLPPLRDVLPKMAYRVVTDPEYRKELVSADPDLPEMWRKH